MSVHVFGRNEYGVACIRCGYFNHAIEAAEACTGKYDDRALEDIQKNIDQLILKKNLILNAREALREGDLNK